jgi:hypothetical protein
MKKNINEIAKFQRLAGLITESEYQEEIMKDEEKIKEALSPEAYERMYNLSNVKAQEAMIKAAEILMNDLTKEGFEVEEVREFFTQLIANDI